jgi:hypothetical protein
MRARHAFVALLCSAPILCSAQHRHEQVIGAAVNFTLSWTSKVGSSVGTEAHDVVKVCFGANADPGHYIGLGFSEAEHGMNHSDLVVAYMGADGSPVVETYFADLFPNAAGGYPNGNSTLEISKTSLTASGGRMEACFERYRKGFKLLSYFRKRLIFVHNACTGQWILATTQS